MNSAEDGNAASAAQAPQRRLRAGRVSRNERLAGRLDEVESGVRFTYDVTYVRDPAMPPISLTLPKRTEPYLAASLFPCFVAMLAEGSLAQAQCRQLRLDERDLVGRLLATCAGDVIGSLRVEALEA